ncbi:MAG: GatB/YqeY domain-containing protein [Pseudonocardiaceae bacterium]
MTELKDRLRADLTTAMKARKELTVATLRMALTAVATEEVAGSTARELSDDEVLAVLTREVKKRREAADAFAGAGREELATRERAESEVLAGYLPAQLGDEEVAALVAEALAEVTERLGERPGPRQMGQVMKVVTPRVAGRASGSRVAAAVRTALAEPVTSADPRT